MESDLSWLTWSSV